MSTINRTSFYLFLFALTQSITRVNSVPSGIFPTLALTLTLSQELHLSKRWPEVYSSLNNRPGGCRLPGRGQTGSATSFLTAWPACLHKYAIVEQQVQWSYAWNAQLVTASKNQPSSWGLIQWPIPALKFRFIYQNYGNYTENKCKIATNICRTHSKLILKMFLRGSQWV